MEQNVTNIEIFITLYVLSFYKNEPYYLTLSYIHLPMCVL